MMQAYLFPRVVHQNGASMANKHIARYLSVFSKITFFLNVSWCKYLIIYRIQDVYEPWLAPI
jgi:hypothetical protein